MNNKIIAICLGIALVTAIAVVEAFDLHPHVSISRCSVIWRGFRHLGFASSHVIVTSNGRPIKTFSQYQYGPVLVMIGP